MKTYSDIDLSKAPSPAFAMCYYSTGVELGTYSEKYGFSFEGSHKESNLLELHIFNPLKEFRAWCPSGKQQFSECIIEDPFKPEDVNEMEFGYIDEFMQLYGEEFIQHSEGKTTLKDKGACKIFYLDISDKDFRKGLSIGVRNYFAFDENDIIKIVNYRLTGIYTGEIAKEVLDYAL